MFKLQDSAFTKFDTKAELLRECLRSLKRNHEVKEILLFFMYCNIVQVMQNISFFGVKFYTERG